MEIAQLVIVGIIVGSIIGLGGIGLTLTYGVMKFAKPPIPRKSYLIVIGPGVSGVALNHAK